MRTLMIKVYLLPAGLGKPHVLGRRVLLCQPLIIYTLTSMSECSEDE